MTFLFCPITSASPVRIVNISEYPIKINEHFLGFFNVNDTTGLGLTEIIIGALKDFGLNMSFCRGQGYDNGANMKGKKMGLQKRILDLNPLAFYLSCGSHSLNLVICDAAQSSLNSINVFGIIQRLFTFSASTSRWNVLLGHTTNFTLKRLCDTRWEAKIESLKAIRYQISSVHDALITIYETEIKTPDIAHEAQKLAEQLKDYSFLVSLITLYNVLF